MCNRLLQKFFRHSSKFAQYKIYDIKKFNCIVIVVFVLCSQPGAKGQRESY